jgi:plastocyanin
LALLIPASAVCQLVTVNGSVQVSRAHPAAKGTENKDVLIWLAPRSGAASLGAWLAKRHFTLLQKNKTFAPHLLVIPVGAEVEFPNQDPFFHNVFSMFEGKRFDLGLYESGTTRSRRFDRPGISYLFCNIHPEMSAVIVTLDTPYYAISNGQGQIAIEDVPAGAYTLHVWREGSSAESLKNLERAFLVSTSTASFGKLTIPDNVPLPLAHKNKYGRDYEDPSPPGQAYEHR